MPRRQRQDDLPSDQQAKQQIERVQDQSNNDPISEEQGEDLLEDDQEDYKAIPVLDNYENQGVDQEQIQDNPQARRKAQIQLEKRDMRKMKEGDEIIQFMDQSLEDQIQQRMQQRRNRIYQQDQEDQEIDERRFLDAEDVKGKLHEWINQDETLKYINQKFRKFLKSFKGTQDAPIYYIKISQMCVKNRQSIQISYAHLKEALPTIAMWVGMEPQLIIPELNKIAYKVAIGRHQAYEKMFPQVFVKIKELPIMDYIRELRYVHLSKLIKIRGVVTIRSQVYNQLKIVFFKCQKCGHLKQPITTNDLKIKLGQCVSCQSTGPFRVQKKKTVYRNYQKITVQESPSQVLPGRIPRSKQVILLGDNIDVAKPGQEVQITGVYKNRYYVPLNVKQGFPLFTTQIQANCIQNSSQASMKNQDEYTQKRFQQISKTKDLDYQIYASIAPSIYGHFQIKRALTLAMFGGVPKLVQGTHKIRGDINVLLLGDPGIAKSQFLKSVQKIFYRCIYTTGKGASAVGLTACVKKDFNTNQWKLEAGALVLADKGICLIDQFDKMNEHDRTSIHQAMEQQTISISKAGIVTTLRARCSVIAAANPLQGRYNSAKSFKDNVDLTDPILSRFDVLQVVKDQINQEIDRNLSTFVINSHIKSHPINQKHKLNDPLLKQEKNTDPYFKHEQLKEYIRYARDKCQPSLPSKNLQIIKQFYLKLREQSVRTGGINIAVRHIESIVRLSQAHAKMYLRNQVTKEDIDVGIKTMLQSFIQTQKFSTAKDLRKKFGKYLL